MKVKCRQIGLLALSVICIIGLTGCKKEEAPAPEKEIVEEIKETEEPVFEGKQVAADQKVVNILLVGQDRRVNDNDQQRTDSMILVTLNREKNTLDLTSFMRDMYVEIPGNGMNRLNAAYVFGGKELLNETIYQNFGVTIDGNVEVDFYEFVNIIDRLGGVDVTLREEEVEAVNKIVREVCGHMGEDPAAHTLSGAGMQHLDGQQALAYCRLRYVGNNDFERTQRQRTVLQQLFNQTREMDSAEMMLVLNDVFGMLNTDLTEEDLMNLMVEVVSLGIQEFNNHNIPEDAGYQSQFKNGMDVLVPDLAACRSLLDGIVK